MARVNIRNNGKAGRYSGVTGGMQKSFRKWQRTLKNRRMRSKLR